MKVDLFDFDLPDERIALHPVSPRDSAKMLMVAPDGALSDKIVTDLEVILEAGDVLVVNDTRVIPAELRGTRHRGEFAASVSFNLHKRVDGNTWLAFARPAKRLKAGDRVVFGASSEVRLLDELAATVKAVEDGQVTLGFDFSGALLDEAIKARGAMPLPPYIGAKRALEERDKADYQTVYAEHDGAVAAPTAGLHFTPELTAASAKRRAAIEAEPADPQHAGADHRQRRAVRRNLALREMAALADHHGADKGRRAGSGVNHDAAGEIHHAPRGHDAAAPDPVGHGRIDKQQP